jgi:hypothetical protein
MKSWLAFLFFAVGAMTLVRADDLPGLKEPFHTVVGKYLFIEEQLAVDSFDGVPAAAAAMKQAADEDKTGAFETGFDPAVGKLAAATDLHTARIALEPVSGMLVASLAEHRIQTGALHSLFCPMVKAYWLQTDGKAIRNPYMGSVMPDCGTFEKQF